MGTLCQTMGSSVYANEKTLILSGIRDNLERKPLSEQDEQTQQNAAELAKKLNTREVPKVRHSGCNYNFVLIYYVTFRVNCFSWSVGTALRTSSTTQPDGSRWRLG